MWAGSQSDRRQIGSEWEHLEVHADVRSEGVKRARQQGRGFEKTLPHHCGRRAQYRGAKARGSLILVPTLDRVVFSQSLDRPDEVRTSEQKRGEAERKYRMAQACAEVLPEGRSRTGIVRRE